MATPNCIMNSLETTTNSSRVKLPQKESKNYPKTTPETTLKTILNPTQTALNHPEKVAIGIENGGFGTLLGAILRCFLHDGRCVVCGKCLLVKLLMYIFEILFTEI